MTAPPTPRPAPELPISLSTNFTGWNAAKVVAYARKFVAKLTDHDSFPTWPPWVASPVQLTEKCNTLETADLDAESHDMYKILRRNTLNKELKKDLKGSIQHVELVAQGNVALLHSLGLNMRGIPVRRNLPLAMLAPQLTVVQGKESGVLDGKVIKCPGTQLVEVQINEGDTSVEENWVKVDFFSRQNFQVRGRVPGKTYSLRARCYGRNGNGPWSAIVTLISL